MALQRKKRTNINGIDGLIQIDEYLDILNRFGIPTSVNDTLTAESLLPFKILFNTTLNKLRIFNTITELWQDAIEIDLSQFYTKSEIDLLFSAVNIQLTRLNGLTLEANTSTSTLYLKDIDGNILSTLSLGFLNNEGTTFVYNSNTETLDLINDELIVLSSIPVSSFISNLVSQIDFNSTLTNRLELKDSGNNVLAFVDITINNILDLQNILDGKEPTITILPISKGGTGKNTISENTFYIGGSNNTLTEKTIQEVFDLLLNSGNGINFTNTSISVVSADNNRIIVTPQGIDLPQISIIPGTYSKVTIDNYGRVIGVSNLTLTDFSTRLNTIANTTSIGIITIDDNGNINIRAIEGSSGRITITNGSMTTGNSIIDLVPTPVVPGTYNNITVDAYGRVISATNTTIPTSLEDLTNPTVNPFIRTNDLPTIPPIPTSLEDLTNPTVNPFIRDNDLPTIPTSLENLTNPTVNPFIRDNDLPTIPTSLENLTNPTVNPFIRDNDLPTSLEDLNNPTVNPFIRDNDLPTIPTSLEDLTNPTVNPFIRTNDLGNFDEIIEGYFNGTSFFSEAQLLNQIIPVSNKLYVDLTIDSNKIYRWGGTVYVLVGDHQDLTTIQTDIKNLMSTTLLTLNGEIEINVDNTKFNFPSGSGIVFVNDLPVKITWNSIIGATTPLLSVAPYTFLGMDENSQLVMTQDLQSVLQMGNVLPIGYLEHTTSTHIDRCGTEPQYNVNLGLQWQQFLETFGSFISDGFKIGISGSNNLGLNVGSGIFFDNGTGFIQNKIAPNHFFGSEVLNVPIKYYNRDGLGDWYNSNPFVLNVDPSKYDNGSTVLANVPAGTFTAQRITYYPPYEYVDIYYGQNYYNTKEEAINAYLLDNFDKNPYLSYNKDIALLIIQQGTTNLNILTNAEIRKISVTGLGGIINNSTGESNTVTNLGTTGIGLFKEKIGVDLKFKKLLQTNSKITITDNIDGEHVNFDVLPNLSISNTTLTLQQTTTGTGGIANATVYDDPANTNISVIVPSIPVGALLVSTQVYITYQSNVLSYTNELLTRITLPNATQLTDLQVANTGNFSGVVTNGLLLTSTTISPAGTWLFQFSDSFNDTGVDVNITEIKVVLNYSINKELFNFDGKLQAHQFIGDGSLLTNLPNNIQMVKSTLLTTQANTSNTTPSVLSNHSFTLPPGKSITLTGILIFVSAAINTGVFYGIQIIQPAGANDNVVGSFSNDIRLSSRALSNNLTDGDVINVAQNVTTVYGTLGTASAAGNNSATIIANITNLATSHSTTINIIFRSEVNGSAVTAKIGSSTIGLIG